MRLTQMQAVDLMNKDTERLRNTLGNIKEDETLRLDGPVICLKGLEAEGSDFPDKYKLVIDVIRKQLEEKANGRPFKVNAIKVKTLCDAEHNFWDDFARHILEVTFYDLRR